MYVYIYGERERETLICCSMYLFMHSLAVSCMCPDQGSNPQPWCIGMMLHPTELPGQGSYPILFRGCIVVNCMTIT